MKYLLKFMICFALLCGLVLWIVTMPMQDDKPILFGSYFMGIVSIAAWLIIVWLTIAKGTEFLFKATS